MVGFMRGSKTFHGDASDIEMKALPPCSREREKEKKNYILLLHFIPTFLSLGNREGGGERKYVGNDKHALMQKKRSERADCAVILMRCSNFIKIIEPINIWMPACLPGCLPVYCMIRPSK